MIKKSELTKELYRTGEISKMLGLTTPWVNALLNRGDMPYQTLPNSNHKRVQREDLIKYLDSKGLYIDDTPDQKHDIIYARVSTHKQEEDLKRQIQTLTNYAITQNPHNIQTITDIASGLNDNRKGLNKLLQQIMNNQVNRVFINYKDRLTRFGYNYIKQICDNYNTQIIIVSNEEQNKSIEFELAEDIITIIHSFSGKLHGLRRKVKEDIINELEK